MKNYFGESHKYDDIIHLPHHVSDKRPQMPVLDRAAQFAPFAALTGYGEAVKETARLTERRIQPDEETLDILNRRLEFIKKHISEQPEVSVCFFRPDPRKDGGAYVTVSGTVKNWMSSVTGWSLQMKPKFLLRICGKSYLWIPPLDHKRRMAVQ